MVATWLFRSDAVCATAIFAAPVAIPIARITAGVFMIFSPRLCLAETQSLFGLDNNFRRGSPVFKEDALLCHSADAGGFVTHHLQLNLDLAIVGLCLDPHSIQRRAGRVFYLRQRRSKCSVSHPVQRVSDRRSSGHAGTHTKKGQSNGGAPRQGEHGAKNQYDQENLSFL